MNKCPTCKHRTDPCYWRLADSEHTYWITSCGAEWWFEDTSLSEIKYCLSCGGKVVDVTHYCQRCNWVIDEPGLCGSCEDTIRDLNSLPEESDRVQSIRLACMTCDREDCDGIKEIPSGWEGVAHYGFTDDEGVWWTHMGDCPDCIREREEESA